jgi:hypothetical protein
LGFGATIMSSYGGTPSAQLGKHRRVSEQALMGCEVNHLHKRFEDGNIDTGPRVAHKGIGMLGTNKSTANGAIPVYLLSAVVLTVIMFVGFAKNYYLRTWIGTRPITAMVHVHGLIMTAWILLFLTQTLLIAKRRTDLHRKLGVAGAMLAIVVVALGVYTIAGSISRQHLDTSIESFALTFVAFDGLSLLLFGGLVITALRARSRPPIHKRLMLMALVSLLPPAFGRLVAYFTRIGVHEIVLALMFAAVLACIVIDTIRHRRLHPALIWSGATVVAANALTYLAQTAD